MTRILLAVAFASAIATSPALAQSAPPLGYKDPGTSTIVAVVIPGGGHLYSGETRKGLTIMGVGLGSFLVGTALTVSSADVDCIDYDCSEGINYAPMALGYAVYFGSWIYGIIDAGDSAHRMNALRGISRVLPESVTPVVSTAGNGGTGVGLSIRF